MGEHETKKRYHHGQLREVLIEAAVELVAEHDIGAVSLRAVARKAGVTNAAPYHHFKDKRALMAAVAAEGFRGLQERVQAEHKKRQDATPIERLHEMGIAYIAFAISHPAHYQVMFRTDLHDGGQLDDVLQQRSTGTFEHLVDLVAQVAPAELRTDLDRIRQQAVLCWSTVHGFASLWIQGAMGRKLNVEDWKPVAQHVVNEVSHRIVASFCDVEIGARPEDL